jgi:hypothetical protein
MTRPEFSISPEPLHLLVIPSEEEPYAGRLLCEAEGTGVLMPKNVTCRNCRARMIAERARDLADWWDGEIGAQEDEASAVALRVLEACLKDLTAVLTLNDEALPWTR